jgi:uncharacterized membrane protein
VSGRLEKRSPQPGSVADPASAAPADDGVAADARWPMAGAVIAAMVLTVLLPDRMRAGPNWALPLVEGILLGALIAGDPGRIDRRSQVLRSLSIGLVAVLVLGALWATVQLVDELIHGGSETDSASELLEAGSVVWLSTIIAFALLYWELDSGGAAARAHERATHPDLAFPEQLNPEVAPAGWRPRFIDYLYLGFTNATAFSPTDTLPVKRWAKMTMMLQSALSLVIAVMIIARAVNILT